MCRLNFTIFALFLSPATLSAIALAQKRVNKKIDGERSSKCISFFLHRIFHINLNHLCKHSVGRIGLVLDLQLVWNYVIYLSVNEHCWIS